MSITTAQIRGARGILNWSQQDLAQRTGISATSIGSIENGQTTPRESTLSTIRKTLETAGIEFIGLEGVRVQTNYVQTLKGAEGFSAFLDDVYNTVILHGTKQKPTDVFLSNVAHENWVKWMGPDRWENHTRRSAGSTRLALRFSPALNGRSVDFVAFDFVIAFTPSPLRRVPHRPGVPAPLAHNSLPARRRWS